jgi:rubrerythrin
VLDDGIGAPTLSFSRFGTNKSPMLGIRSYACEVCETVCADIEPPPGCPSCGASPVTELARESQARDYFAPARKEE